jgi:hypothetical protein
MPKMHILIATPTYDGTVHVTYMRTVIEILTSCGEAGVQASHMTTEGSLVELARNKLAARALNDPTVTHLLFIDSDIGFSLETMVRLIANANLPIVGVACPRKAFEFNHNVGKVHGEVEGRSGIFEVDAIGTGIMLIQREVLEKLAEKVPNYFDGGFVPHLFKNEMRGTSIVGEDINFCHLWREQGGKVYALLNAEVTHSGQAVFRYDSNLLQAKG